MASLPKKIKFLQNEICVISDLHIGIHQASPVWHKIALDFAVWLKNKLDREGIRDIVIAGDVWHDRNEISVNTIHTATAFFNILKSFNIVILVGNHDAYYRDRADINSIDILSGWKNIHIVNDITTVNAFDRVITFVPWASDLNKVPKSDIIFGHFEITSFRMNKSKICAHGINSGDLLSKAPLIISGHFHLRDVRRFPTGTILYLGCPYELDWGDCSTIKGIHILDIEKMQFDFIQNTLSPKHIKFRLSEVLNSETGMIETLKTTTPGNFINFLIDKEISSDKVDALINKLSSLQPLYVRTEFFDTTKYNPEEVEYEFTGVDIPAAISEFINTIEVKDKQGVLNYTLDLYKRVN